MENVCFEHHSTSSRGVPFLLVNIPAAESLYKLVGEWCGFDVSRTAYLAFLVTQLLRMSHCSQETSAKDSCLLDICSGTGTIGQIYSAHVRRVLGFEICPEAVEDAKANAASNSEFRAEQLEQLLPAGSCLSFLS